MKILLVEDDTDFGNILQQYLEMNNFEVTLCRDGQKGWEVFQANTFDLCILDVMLPEKDGFTLGKAIRRHNPKMPFLFLTAKKLKEDRLKGLKLGADDYITKPFDADELVLRVQNILRRSGKLSEAVYAIGQCSFDFDNLTLQTPGQIHVMTLKEAELFRCLVTQANQVVKRDLILKELWGDDDYFNGRSMDVFISRLRKYIDTDKSLTLETVRGVGYVFKVN